MAFDEKNYEVVSERDLGQINGWNGNVRLVRYKYNNRESVKIVVAGETKGKPFEWKLMSGVPVEVLAGTLLPALATAVKEEIQMLKESKTKFIPSPPSNDRRRRARA